MDCRQIGWNIVRVGETTSTNSELAKMAAAGAAEGTVLVAARQTAGRGRQGRTWLSSPGDSLCFSILLRPHVEPARAATLSILAGVAVAETIERFLPGVDVSVKWPNDILARGRKICGILCEMGTSGTDMRGATPHTPTAQSQVAGPLHDFLLSSACCPTPSPHVIVGIGVNVNLDASSLPQDVAAIATSMKGEAAQRFDSNAVLSALLGTFGVRYGQWLDGGLSPAMPFLESHDWLKGRVVGMHLLNEPISGVGRGISPDGALLLETADGVIRPVYSGEAHVGSAWLAS